MRALSDPIWLELGVSRLYGFAAAYSGTWAGPKRSCGMVEIRFKPVCLKLDGGRTRVVASVEHAMFVLRYKWPIHHTTREKALQICQYALKGEIPASAARDALVQAATLAGIYINITIKS